MNTLLGFCSVAIGLALLFPAVYTLVFRTVPLKPRAFQPILRFPLSAFGDRTSRRAVVLPTDEDIGRDVAERRFIVVASERLAHCWKKFAITVTAATANRELEFTDAVGAPSAWSSNGG